VLDGPVKAIHPEQILTCMAGEPSRLVGHFPRMALIRLLPFGYPNGRRVTDRLIQDKKKFFLCDTSAWIQIDTLSIIVCNFATLFAAFRMALPCDDIATFGRDGRQ
jgi:hypothetical protein